jgi:hypothetical protein
MHPSSPAALETAPALTVVWRDLATRLMELCRVEPRLLDRVTRAPKPAFHAYCAYFAATTAAPCDVVARRAYDSDPKRLLADALGADGPITPVWRLMKKLEADQALPLATYLRLATLAETPRIGVMMRSQTLGERTLDAFDTLSRDIAHDDLIAAAAAGIVPTTPRNIARTREALVLLRAFGVADDGLRTRLAKCRDMRQLQRAFATAFQNAPLPDFGIDFGHRLRRLTTVADLRRAGQRYGNCLAGLPPHVVDDYLAGTSCLVEFTRDGAPCALVTLGIVSPFVKPILVKICTMLGPKNSRLETGIRTELIELLEAVPGIQMMESNLACSLVPILEAHDEGSDTDDEAFERIIEELDADDLIPL